MSLHDIVHASEAYQFLLENGENLKRELHEKIKFFRSEIIKIGHKYTEIDSISPIQGIVIPGNDEVIKIAQKIQQHGFDVRPIRFPSVASGTERLRICIHMFNTEKEIGDLIKLLS
jgi:8-amino-7-oxononanoate synthase